MVPDEFFTEGLRLRGATHSEVCTFFQLSSAADAEFDQNTSLAESPTVDVCMVSFFFSGVGGRGRTSNLTEEGDTMPVARPMMRSG
jgi:hypothetical protein